VPGVETRKSISRTPTGGWRCDLVAATAEAQDLLPEVITGYGESEQEASWDAIMGFAKALSKLSDEQRKSIQVDELPGDSRLLGSTSHDEFLLTTNETEARAWADERKRMHE
jgi:hypothetical protein